MAQYQGETLGYAETRGRHNEVGGDGGVGGIQGRRQAPSPLQFSQGPSRRNEPRMAMRNNTLAHPGSPGLPVRMGHGHAREPSLRRIASEAGLPSRPSPQRMQMPGAMPRKDYRVHGAFPQTRDQSGGYARSPSAMSGEMMMDDTQYEGSLYGMEQSDDRRKGPIQRGQGLPPKPPPAINSRPSSRGGDAISSPRTESPTSSRPELVALPPSLVAGRRPQRTSQSSTTSTKLKMPLAFNSIAREQNMSLLNGDLYSSPTCSPISVHAPSPSANQHSFPDEVKRGLPPTSHPSSNSTSQSSHWLDEQPSLYLRKQMVPNPPFQSLPNSLHSSPHSSTLYAPSVNFARHEGRASFRSGITTDRSSVLTTSSDMFTVDEAIGMYDSDTDPEDEDSRMRNSLTLEQQKELIEREFQQEALSTLRERYDRESATPSPTSSVEDAPVDSVPTPASPEPISRERSASDGSNQPISPSKLQAEVRIDEPAQVDGPDEDEQKSPGARMSTASTGGLSSTVVPTAQNESEALPPNLQARPCSARPPAPRDRYGFKKENTYISLQEYDNWNTVYEEVLQRRRQKWDALMRDAGLTPGENGPVRFPPKSQKLKRYVRKGIPPEWRGAAWFWFAGGPAILAKNAGVYQKLLEGRDLSSAPDYEIIERDLHRTFPDNIQFKPEVDANGVRTSKQMETPILQSLRRVLVAFSLHVPKIGYCQSLNFLAGLLLLFMDEEKAFWMLYIITQHLLPGTHDVSLGSDIDQGVLMLCVRDSLPAVWNRIGHSLDGVLSNEISEKLPPVTLATLSWFMNAYVCNLPIETTLRVWDCWFYEGSKTLFRIALAILKMGENEIRAATDQGEVIQVVQTLPRKLIDATALMELCFKRRNGFGHLSQAEVDQKREERRRVHLLASRQGAASARPGSRSKTTMANITRDDSHLGLSARSGKFLRNITGKM